MALDVERWHRSHPEARLAGVCAALAHALAVPVAAVRLAFVALSLFHLIGMFAYAALWLVIPVRPGGESQLEMLLQRALQLARMLQGRHGGRNDPPPTFSDVPQER